MKSNLKVHIRQVSEVLTSASVKSTDYRQVLTVIEVPEHNPLGKDYNNLIPFEIEIHNNNIEAFAVKAGNIGDVAEVEIIFSPFKKDQQPTTFRLLVNRLQFVI